MGLTLLPGAVFAADRTSGEQGLEGPSGSAAAASEKFEGALDAYGKVALKAGTYEKWIDRIDIPEYALNFYKILEEAADNDGYNDFLIDDKYFDTAQPGNDCRELKVGDIYYDSGKTSIIAAVIDAPYDSDWAAVNAVYNEASQYIFAAYQAFDRDHNEVFWLDNSSNSWGYKSHTTDYKTATVWIFFDLKNYTYETNLRANHFDAKGIKSAITAMENNIAGILSGIPKGADRYETLAYFNEWLTANNEYNTLENLDDGPWDIREASNALEGKAGVYGPVCESYARALKVLCDRTGIPCTLVNGDARSAADGQPGAHMWNYVQMENGKWYAVDVTWDDPSYSSKPGKVSGGETDKWLLLGEHTLVNTEFGFLQSHPVRNQYNRTEASFTNGPTLNPAAYARLTYSGMPQTLKTGSVIALTANRFPARKSDISTYSYSVSSGTLPAGLTLDRFTGAISGTLTAAAIEKTTVTVTLYENGLTAASCDIVFPGENRANPFTDVSQSSWYYGGVAYMTQNGLMSGVGGGKFDPDGTTDRGMIVTLLYNLAGRPPVTSMSAFTDVPAGKYYTAAVAWAAANRIVGGYGDGTFGPDDKITREQMATILYHYADYMNYDVSGRSDISGYADVGSVSSFALTAMRWANSEGLITGRTTTTLVPKGTATRAETAVLLAKFCRQIAGMK